MKIEFRPMTRLDAEQVAAWRYAGDYAMYNVAHDQASEAVDYMADPANGYFAAYDGSELVAFVSIGADGRVPGWSYDERAIDVGTGVRPDLTGRGQGWRFIEQALAFVASRTGAMPLRATVAAWNDRARVATERAGFVRVGSFTNPAGMTFVVLEHPADAVARPP
jgi:RimJ/RimL family protein N-acetyltransferase